MKYMPEPLEINWYAQGSIFEVGSLVEALGRLHDLRDARGVRYPLVTVLVLIILAKLAGESHMRGIAEWVELRAERLAQMLHLRKGQAPHATTYSRILGKAVDIQELDQVLREFFMTVRGSGADVSIALDGKTMRGTIAAGQSHGVHLLAAYLPDSGWVLMQVEVGRKENEIPVAARILSALDLQGKVVTGDALLAQRGLSVQIVEGGGDYLWTIKKNQLDTYEDIQTLFEPEPRAAGFGTKERQFRTGQTIDKGHGRIEKRRITVSSDLEGYLNWPYAKQVFKVGRRLVRVRDGKVTEQVRYGVTSLTEEEAGPERLLELIRKHWAIENGLHYRRDDTLREDRCCLRVGTASEATAAINNLVLSLLFTQGRTDVPTARRQIAAAPEKALPLLFARL